MLVLKKNKKEYFFDEILSAPDRSCLIDWLRCQSILKIDEKHKIIMSHAGISPQWNINNVKKAALEIENLLSHKNYSVFLKSIYYSNDITFWTSNLNKLDQLRYSLNAFTRMRYCYPDSRLNMFYKTSPNFVKYPLKPWFLMPSQISKNYSIFFGHWSSLKGTYIPKPFFFFRCRLLLGWRINYFKMG